MLVLVTAATELNDTYLFFASWTDLQGAFTGTVTQTSLSRGTTAAQALHAKVQGHAARAVPHLPALAATRFNAAGVGTFTVAATFLHPAQYGAS